jgi:hypothetical protein
VVRKSLVALIGISNGESDLIDRALASPAERLLKILARCP